MRGMRKKSIEENYDTAIRFFGRYESFDSELISKALELDHEESNALIEKMLLNNAIVKVGNGFAVSKTYNHSDYLLERELKQDKLIKKESKKSKYQPKVLPFIASIVFIIACYFAIREPMSFLLIAPLSLLCLSLADRVGVGVSCVGVVLVCVVGMTWINSMTPLFGDEYAAEQEYRRVKDQAKKYEQEQEKQNVLNISRSQDSVGSQLKDPTSAKFSSERVGKGGAVCGLVNAKNSFGGYAGDARYISIAGNSSVDDGGEEFSSLWAKLCK